MIGRSSASGPPLNFYNPGSLGNPDYLDFYTDFRLDDIRTSDEDSTTALQDITQRALDCGRETILGLFGPDQPVIIVAFPAGAGSRHVWVGPDKAIQFARQPFGDYELLERYVGLWSANHSCIEAVVDFADPLVLLPYMGQGGLQPAPMAEAQNARGATLRLGAASPIAQALLLDTRDDRPNVTLRLEGLTVQTAAEASSRLDVVGNAFLFQFDLANEGLPRLREPPDSQRDPWTGRFRYDRRRAQHFTYPDRGLEAEPLLLYHHARKLSDDIPLLKFLTYYHVLEFFFPTYSRLEVIRSLQAEMRNPEFDVESKHQISRLLDLVPNRGGHGGLGPESKQLRATIKRCVDLDQLRDFLNTHRDKESGSTLAGYLS